MALVDKLNVFVREKVVPKIVNAALDESPTLTRFLKNPEKWSGTKLRIPIEYAYNPNAMSYSGSDQLAVAQDSGTTYGEWDPRQYNVGLTLKGLDLELAKTPDAIMQLLKYEIERARRSIKDTMSTDFFGANSTGKKIDGLGNILEAPDGTTNITTYAGIKGGPGDTGTPDIPEWVGNIDSTTTALTREAFLKHYLAQKFDNDKPTLAITNDDIYAAIESTWFAEYGRVMYDKNMADLGFDTLKYHGVTFITDDKVGTGQLYLLNEKHLKFHVVPSMNFKWLDFTSPEDYDLHTGHIRWYGNLVCDNRRTQGKFTGITSVAAA